ncbi:MAG: hypothetical protein OEZ39_04430 [Gammaproteobacteria bacterium]|nr:hypothetical protein [Gammaproteobacteria bacterium]MDH5651105.1 hypothetical protein [Gammaproteobacteria bacterium]
MTWTQLEHLVDTAYRRVVPLYSFDTRGHPFLIASPVPFKTDGLSFLITATHACFRNGIPLPLFVYGEKKLHALTDLRGAWDYMPGKNPDLDVAIIRLAADCADDLQALYWFCTPDDVGTTRVKTLGVHYLIAGYPASRNKKKPVQYGLPSKATALVTGDICSVHEVGGEDKSDEFHFGIKFPYKQVDGCDGKKFVVPKPYGMSGGGVWLVEIDTIERLSNTPYLVGIGIEYHKPAKSFVATRVHVVAPLVRDLYEANTHI